MVIAGLTRWVMRGSVYVTGLAGRQQDCRRSIAFFGYIVIVDKTSQFRYNFACFTAGGLKSKKTKTKTPEVLCGFVFWLFNELVALFCAPGNSRFSYKLLPF
jgi:hypothetical protein